MPTIRARHLLPTLLVSVAAAGLTAVISSPQVASPSVAARERAYRANNIGVARLEQFDFPGAAATFRQALAIDPQLALARLNLGIALFYGGDAEAARAQVAAAQPALPGRPQPDYMLGLIARAGDRPAEALEAFSRVHSLDPDDVGAMINLAQLAAQQRRDEDAIGLFGRALMTEPYNATAAYGLATALLRGGNTVEGEAAMARFERLRETGYAITYAQAYLEQGRYAAAIASTGAEAELVDANTPAVGFIDVSGPMRGQPGPGSVAMFDLDGDGDLDVTDSGPGGVRLLRNTVGRLTDVTSILLRDGATAPTTALVAGDYNNDMRIDLAVLRPGGVVLLQNTGAAGLRDVTTAANLAAGPPAPRSAAWLDADHDGDLDLFVAFGSDASATTRLYRNNGNGGFTDVTTESGLLTARAVTAVVPTDFDNRRDVDLLLTTSAGNPFLFKNLRDGSFRDVTALAGLSGADSARMAAIGDTNKDGYPDLFFARESAAGVMATSDGRGRYVTAPAPPEVANTRAAQVLDYDGDGLLDLFALTADGPRLLRNLGQRWVDESARAITPSMASAVAGASSLAAGDLNGDGHVDLVIRGAAGVIIWRNGNTLSRSLGVRLTPRVSNRSSVGAKIEIRAGSLYQRHETYAATPSPAPAGITFGLGARTGADVVRVLWPSGILQAETASLPRRPSLSGALAIEELDRKPSSCPYLFTWNGERFEFISDFMGGGEMGLWVAPGVRPAPDPDEYVRITGDRLRAKNGRFELRVANELEEALFLDRAQLVAVAHPRHIEIYPNEGLVATPRPFTIYTTADARPPLAATDTQGRNVLDRLIRIDRRYVDSFDLEPVRGYAAPHTLTMVLPRPGPSGRRLLLLTGWTDYAFSSDNVAAYQGGLELRPPSLEVRRADGTWETAIDEIGIPVGRPQTVVVDLTNRVPASVRDVRIRTSMRVYWDQALVDTSDGQAPHAIVRLEPVSSILNWRGFSAEVTPDGREPRAPDYDRVSPQSPWKLLPGRYTREGDVQPLVTATDDMFVVSRPGDQIALSFDASALPPLPEGWTRTFLFYADGFSKEMNLHSASPDELLPLPFHGMTRYPYASPEVYPSTPAHRAYLERYNTRVVPRTLPPLELAGADTTRRRP